MYNVKILTRAEMAEETNINDVPEYEGAELFIVSTNDENPYVGVIYENRDYEDGEMWVYGATYDSQMSTLKEMLDQIASGD